LESNDDVDYEGTPAVGDEGIHEKPILIISISLNIVLAYVLRVVGGAMYPFFIVVSLWSALYILTLAYYLSLKKHDLYLRVIDAQSTKSLFVLIVLTILPRLAWIGSKVLISLDALWYIDFGKFILWGDMPYADFYFPYPPVFGYFIYGVMVVAPLVDTYRILAVIFDVAIVIVLWHMIRVGIVEDRLSIAPFAYALLPFSIIESGFNGHFEPIANLFLILSIWCVISTRYRTSGMLLGLSAATKVYAAFLTPVFLLVIGRNRKKAEFLMIALVTVFLTFIPFSVPVWLRGDMLFPGTAMPGLSTGFFDALTGFFFRLSFPYLVAMVLVAVGVISLVGVFLFRPLTESRFRNAIVYDILTASVGALLGIMILLVWIYPFLPPASGVYWRYPVDVALARGATTAVGTLFIIWMTWRRWRAIPERPVSKTQLMLVASVLLMLLLTLSKQVFYGWYLLWVIPPLLFLRDRRLVYLALACMLLMYPSYTHDNFLSLGYDEVPTWSDDFTTTEAWQVKVNLTNTGLSPGAITAKAESVNGMGAFLVDATGVSNGTALGLIEVVWTRNVSIPITPQTEMVVRVSASWDPTFRKYALMGLYFDGLNSTGHTVSWPIIAPWLFSPSNITFVLWRFTFSGQGIQVHPVELTRLRLVVNEIKESRITIFVDKMYSTEVVLLTPASFLLAALLALPSMVAVLYLSRKLPRHNRWYERGSSKRSNL